MGNKDIIHVRCGKRGKWYYRIENGDNRKVLATSQTYTEKRTAVKLATALHHRCSVYNHKGVQTFIFDLEVDGE